MANTARYLLGENISPGDIDKELGRDGTEAITPFEESAWYLDRGLSVTSIERKTGVDLTGYNQGKISLETLLKQLADGYHDGDIAAAREKYNTPDYLAWFKHQGQFDEKVDRYTAKYTALGKYKEIDSKPTKRHITSALYAGSVILFENYYVGEHREMLFLDGTSDDNPVTKLYSPDEVCGTVDEFDLSNPRSLRRIARAELLIVSQ
jgi:hypothetical protein